MLMQAISCARTVPEFGTEHIKTVVFVLICEEAICYLTAVERREVPMQRNE